MRNVTFRRIIFRLLKWIVQIPRVYFYYLLSNNRVYGQPKRFQPIQAVGRGKIIFKGGVKVGVFPSPYFFSTYAYFDARKTNAEIVIGENTWINNNFSAIADSAGITIGSCCLIGANVEIIDSDFHAIKLEDRDAGELVKAKPVLIGNDVFIGSNVKIMKGVSIGDGSAIGNGSIVTTDIPSRVIAAGNPARVIKKIE